MKLFVRYFLLLCLFVWGAGGHLFAQTYDTEARYTPIQILDKAGHKGFAIHSIPLTTFKTTISGRNTIEVYATDTEEEPTEDDEHASAPKAHDNTHYFTTFFYTQTSGELLKTSPNFGDNFSHFSSQKYIKLRVIRV